MHSSTARPSLLAAARKDVGIGFANCHIIATDSDGECIEKAGFLKHGSDVRAA